MLQEIAKQDLETYNAFYEQCEAQLKRCFVKERCMRQRCMFDLLRFHTTMSGDRQISLDQYVTQMSSEQSCLYYIIASDDESKEELAALPPVKLLTERGLEVIFMDAMLDDAISSWMKTYDGKQFVSAYGEIVDDDADGASVLEADGLGGEVADTAADEGDLADHRAVGEVAGDQSVSVYDESWIDSLD